MQNHFDAGLRIGITQRRLPATSSTFERDALDADWSDWFSQQMPFAAFAAMPNFAQPSLAVEHVQRWALNAFFLSGGEDIGSSAVRDDVEVALLSHARSHRLPVVGICRGMQLMHLWSGGTLKPSPTHLGAPHIVHAGEAQATVNSWHRFTIRALRPGWQAVAKAEDQSIEAMQHTDLPWLGMMWHPERVHGNPAFLEAWLASILNAKRRSR